MKRGIYAVMARLMLLAVAGPEAMQAASVTLLTNDQLGSTSFTGSTNWSNGAAPSAANDYSTVGCYLRTPADANNYTFGGKSLTLPAPVSYADGNFLYKGTAAIGANQTYTINNFTNAGGLIRSGGATFNSTCVITGNVFSVSANSTLLADQSDFIINSPLVGSGILTNNNNNLQTITYGGNNSAFAGKLLINGNVLFSTQNAVPGNPAASLPDQIILGGGGTLSDNAGILLNNASGGVTLAGNATVSTTTNTTIAETITGAYSLTKSGAGILILSNATAETYTGATVVNSGTLTLVFPNAVTSGLYESSSLTINNGASVLVGSDNALAGSVGTLGELPITVNAGGTLSSPGTSDYGVGSSTHLRGVLTLAGGTLANGGTGAQTAFGTWDLDDGLVVVGGTNTSTISALNVISSQAGGTSFNVVNGGTSNGVDLNVTGTLTSGSSLPDTGIILTGGGTVALLGTNTYAGATTISAGTLMISGAGELGGGTYAGAITNNGTFTYGSSQPQTLSGVVSGTGSLIQSGAGTLTLTGMNSYGGGTLVNEGVLQLPAGGVLSGGAASVAAIAGAQLVVSGGSLKATNSSNIGIPSAGLLVSSGSASFAGGLTTDLNTDEGYLIEVTGGVLMADSLTLGRSGTYSTSQPAAGSTNVGLYMSGGTVNLTNNLDMCDSVHVNSSVNARLDGGSLTVGGAVIIGLNNGGRWSVLDVNGGTLTVNDPSTGIDVGGPYGGNAELLVRAGTATAGIISLGQTGVSATNMTAAVNLTGGSLYVGSGGIAQVSTGAGFTPSITLNGGTLGAVSNWSSSVPMTLGGATLQTADALGVAHNISLSGVLSGSGGLTKTGSGQLTLSGADTYNGGTTVTAGTLSLGSSNVLPSTGTLSLNGGTFSSAGHSNTLGTLILQSSSSLALGTNTTGTLTFAGGSYTGGTLTINNWSGTAGQSGTADRIFITNAPSQTFLTNLNFAYYQSGSIRLGTGEIVPVGTGVATNLAITSVNGGSPPTVGAPFNVLVQSQGSGGRAQNVTVNTTVSLSVNTGSGTLGGTLTGTILSGTSSVTISGVTYSKAQSNVILTVTRTAGESLTAGNSSSFTVNPATVTILSGLTANNKVYNGSITATLSSNNVVLSGVLAGDAANAALSTNGYTAVFASAGAATELAVTVAGLTLTGSAAGNYTLTQPTGLTANITLTTTLYKTTTTTLHGSADWTTADGSGTATAPTSSYIGEFAATPTATELAAETLGGATTLGGLLFDNDLKGPVTIASGNTLTLGAYGLIANTNVTINCAVALSAGQAWNANQGETLAVGGVISGTGVVLTNAGGGTVTLAGANTFTGGVDFNGGVLNVAGTETSGASGPLGAGGILAFNGGALQYSSADTADYSSRFSTAANQAYLIDTAGQSVTFSTALTSSGGTLTKIGAGTLILGGNNTYAGTTVVTNGVLVLKGNNTGAGAVMVTNGATLQLANPNAVLGPLILASGTTVQLRGDASGTNAPASLALPNVADTLNFDAGPVTGGVMGCTLGLTNTLAFPATQADEIINVTGSNTYTLALGTLIGPPTTGHLPFEKIAINTLAGGASLTLGTVESANYSSWLNFQGGGTVLITGNLTNNSNGSAMVYVTDGTQLTLKGNSTLGGNASAAPDAYKYEVAHGTLILDNNNALTNVTTGTGIKQSVFILGAATNGFSGPGYSAPAGVMVNTNNSWNATVYLGDANSTGGLTLNALNTNHVSDGDATFTNSGVFTLGGQNTSGVNTYANPIILGWTANLGKSVTLVAATGGEVDFSGAILANGTDTTAGITVGNPAFGGTVKLLGANTYPGPTTLSKGTLALGSGGSLAAGSSVSVAAGATFDVSALPSPYTWGTGAGLTAGGTGATAGTTAATINGAAGGVVSLGSQPVALTFTPASFSGDTNHPALLISQGGLTLSGNAITVSNAAGTVLGAGIYRLIQVADGTINGTPNAVPTTTGTGLATGTTAALSVSGGYLNLVVQNITTTTLSAVTTPQTYGTVTFSATVSPASASGTVTFKDGSATLGSATLSGGTVTFTPTAGQLTVAGSPHSITAAYGGDGLDTVSTSVAAALTMTAKALNYTGLSAAGKVYNASTTATISGTASVLSAESAGTGGGSDGQPYTGDTVGFTTGTLTGAFASANLGTALAVTVTGGVSLSGAQSGNYSVGTPSPALTANITAATVTITSGLTVNNKVYNGTTAATINSNTVGLSGVVAGDSASVKLATNSYTASFASSSVGTGVAVTVGGLTLTGTAAANYALTQPTGLSANIVSGTVTITSGLAVSNKVYDGTTAATITSNNVVLGGVVAGDTAKVMLSTNGGSATFAISGAAGGIGLTVGGLTLTGSAAGNYTLTQPAGLTASISAKPLNYTGLSAVGRVYNASTAATLSGTASVLSSETAGTGASTDGQPYAGDAVGFTTGTLTGTFAGASVGTSLIVTVTGGLTLNGASSGNYSVGTSSTALTANITAKALNYTGLSAVGKVYNANTVATISGTASVLSAEVAGAGSGADGKPYTGDTVGFTTGTLTGVFASANVGTALAVTVTGGPTLSGAQSGNYSVGAPSPALTANLTTAPVTVASGITGNNKVYDGTKAATINSNTVVLNGVMAGDAASVALSTNGDTATFASAGVAGGVAVTVGGLTLTGTAAGNYSLTQPTGLSANITSATVALTSGLTVNSKVYDGTTAATLSSNNVVLSGVVAGDSVGLHLSTNNYSAAFAGVGAASGIAVTVSGLTLVGSAATNYALIQPAGLTAGIAAAPVTVTSGITVNNKVYDGATAATINSNNAVLNGVVAGDAAGLHLSTNGWTAAFASAGAANGIAVTVGGLTLTGGIATNYTLLQPAALTASITASTVTIASGVTANNKVYDGATAATLSSNSVVLSGVVAGDTAGVHLSTNGCTAAFATASVGTGVAVTVGGLTLTGSAADNYTLTPPGLSANITAKGLTVTGVTAANKVYDTTTNAVVSTNGAVLVGVVDGDLVTLGGPAAGTFATKMVANGKTVTISGLTIGGVGVGNYTLSQPVTTANITSVALTVNGITANNKVYDGTTTATVNPSGATLVGVLGGDTATLNPAGATGTFATASPGTGKTVTVGGLTLSGADAGNYALTPPTATATISATILIGSASGSLNWSALSNGSGSGGQPGAADTITVDQNVTLTVDVTNGVCASVQLSVSGQGSGTLAFNPGSQLTVSGAVTNGASGAPAGTIGTLTMTGGGTLICQGLASFVTPTPSVWLPGVGTVQLTSTNSLPATVFTSFNDLILAAGTTTLGLAVTVTNLTQCGGNLALSSNALTVINTHLAGTNTVSGTGAYTNNSGLLETAGPAGVSGNLTTSGTLSLTAAAFLFDGTAAQVTSAALPATVASLTISNAAGVTLSQAVTTTNLTLTVGDLTTAACAFTVAGTNGTAVSGGSYTSYVIGALQKTFGPGPGQAFTFPIGTATAYTPVGLTSLNLGGSSAGFLTFQSTDGEAPQLGTSGITTYQSVNRYWTLSQSGAAITNYTISFNYPANDLDAGAFPSVFIAQIDTNSVWSSESVAGTPTATSTVITNYSAGSAIFAIGDPVSDQTITFVPPGNQTYGVGPLSLSATASSGLTVAFSVTGPATVTNTTLYLNGAGSVTILASQSGNLSYGPATPVTVSLLVSPKSVAILSGITANHKVYDGTTAATLSSNNVVLTGVLAGDTAAVALSTNGYAAAFASVGVAPGIAVTADGLTLTGAAVANYALTQPAGLTASITVAPLTVTANNTNRIYGAPNPAFTAGYTGFVGGDPVAVVQGAPGFSTSATSGSPVNTYPVTPSLGSLSATNYSFTTFDSGSLFVTRADTTNVVATSANPALIGSNVTFTAVLAAVLPGAGTPTGTVQFLADGLALGASAALSGGVATLTTNFPAEDTHVITAQYAGDANFTGSTNFLSPDLEVLGAPVVGNATLPRYPTTGAKQRVALLLANDSDPDDDPITLYSVSAVSAQGGTVTTNGGWVCYTPPSGFTNADSFTYVITDGSLLATGTVAVTIVTDADTARNLERSQNLGPGGFLTSFFGIPDRTYTIQSTTNLVATGWLSLGAATADATGWFQYADSTGTNAPTPIYRSTYP